MKSSRILLLVIFSFFIIFSNNLKAQDCTEVEELSNNLTWDFQISSDDLLPGDQFCIECVVDGFVDVLSFQYAFNYDPEILNFQNLDNLGSPLIGQIDGNFTQQAQEQGSIPILWTNGNGEGQTIPSNSSIFKLYFEVIGDAGSCSTWDINGSSVEIEIAFELPDGTVCPVLTDINDQLSGGDLCIACEDLSILPSICSGVLDFSVCGGEPLYSYAIEGADNFLILGTITDGDTISIDLPEEGDYIISVTDGSGVNITELISYTIPEELIISGEVLCQGQTTTLSTLEGYSNYTWTNASGQNILPPDDEIPWEIIVTESGLYTLTTLQGSCVDSAQFNLQQQNTPVAQVEDFTVCNSSQLGESTTVDVEMLISNASSNYVIVDSIGVTLSSTVIDFDGQAAGIETYYVILEGTAPCPDIAIAMNIEIIDCGCPTLDLSSVGNFCNSTSSSINLYDFIGATTSLNGTFIIYTSIGELAQVQADSSGLLLMDENFEVGNYTVEYTLTDVPSACDDSTSQPFSVFETPETQFISLDDICNTDTLGQNTVLDLNNINVGTAGSWQDENENILTSNLIDFNGSQPGVYNYTFVNTDGPCVIQYLSVSIEVLDCFPTSTNELEKTNLNIYPNPSNGIFNVELEQQMEFVVYDTNGRTVKMNALKAGMNLINLDHLVDGVYLIKFYTNENFIQYHKLIISVGN